MKCPACDETTDPDAEVFVSDLCAWHQEVAALIESERREKATPLPKIRVRNEEGKA